MHVYTLYQGSRGGQRVHTAFSLFPSLPFLPCRVRPQKQKATLPFVPLINPSSSAYTCRGLLDKRWGLLDKLNKTTFHLHGSERHPLRMDMFNLQEKFQQKIYFIKTLWYSQGKPNIVSSPQCTKSYSRKDTLKTHEKTSDNLRRRMRKHVIIILYIYPVIKGHANSVIIILYIYPVIKGKEHVHSI